MLGGEGRAFLYHISLEPALVHDLAVGVVGNQSIHEHTALQHVRYLGRQRRERARAALARRDEEADVVVGARLATAAAAGWHLLDESRSVPSTSDAIARTTDGIRGGAARGK